MIEGSGRGYKGVAQGNLVVTEQFCILNVVMVP